MVVEKGMARGGGGSGRGWWLPAARGTGALRPAGSVGAEVAAVLFLPLVFRASLDSVVPAAVVRACGVVS